MEVVVLIPLLQYKSYIFTVWCKYNIHKHTIHYFKLKACDDKKANWLLHSIQMKIIQLYNHLHILISGKECSLSPPTSVHSIITSTGNGRSGAYLCGEEVNYQCEDNISSLFGSRQKRC